MGKITRSKAAGVVALALIVIGISLTGQNLKIEVSLMTIIAILWVTCLMRVGLLALFVARFVQFTLLDGVVTSDLTRWYAWRGLVELGLVLAIALYGFKVSLGGRSMFGAALED